MIKATPENGYEKQQIDKNLYLTNMRSHFMNESDFVEVDLTVPTAPVIRMNMTKKPDDHSFARGFPMLVRGTAFLKLWDSWGYNVWPRLFDDDGSGRKRAVGHEEAPYFDFSPITEALGYPCLVADMPKTTVYADAHIPSSMKVNTLIDTYCLKLVSDENGRESWVKYLNVQFQLDCGWKNIPGAHAWGWSGGTVLGQVTINGTTCVYAYKRETAGGNDFPFLSFSAIDAAGNYIRQTEVCTSDFWDWIIANWDQILKEAEAVGVSFGDITAEGLKSCTADGVHAGNEVLGGAVGDVNYVRLEIVTEAKQQSIIEPVAAGTVEPAKDYQEIEPMPPAAPINPPIKKRRGVARRLIDLLKSIFKR